MRYEKDGVVFDLNHSDLSYIADVLCESFDAHCYRCNDCPLYKCDSTAEFLGFKLVEDPKPKQRHEGTVIGRLR